MTPDDYARRFSPDDTPGQDALEAHLAARLGPAHRRLPLPAARRLKAALDPEAEAEPIDSVAIWARPAAEGAPAHLLYVGFGFSTLGYAPEAAGGEASGLGAEPVFRLAAAAPDPGAAPTWPPEMMTRLGRYALRDPEALVPGFLAAFEAPLSPEGEITALLMVPDPELEAADTPHGEVAFLLALGVTAAEAAALAEKRVTVAAMLAALEAAGQGRVTDLSRRGSVF
ncbi:suppressor of fused domain protein [Albimonas pacifica]|uniref:Suppressor of fused protein (SUFU) n=1 Tax=Albimonas pacifica TaxID=1114924 RepID=A0A1I3HTJ3_9RHOB|nr:suppressor of fused domain protein [Albimonas pacifica]SFI38929.1 Suppressor of fused protein (SUFU) [Albimonas pacifica]